MNPRTFGSSIWLLAVVAVTALFIGAVTHFDTTSGQSNTVATVPAPPASVPSMDGVAAPASSPSGRASVAAILPADLSPGLADVIRLAQSHVAEETLLAFVQTSGQDYKPTADEILYLYDLGVSDRVVSALVKKPETATVPLTPALADAAVPASSDIAAEPPPPAVPPPMADNETSLINPLPTAPDAAYDPGLAYVDEPPPPAKPQDSYFYDSLSPYGSWLQMADGSWVWQPMVTSVNPAWTPYLDRGQWLLTDDGWYWASDYSWGWAVFHYGRWSREKRHGWVWHPGVRWAPAWVAWRHSEEYAGWAPLPPGVLFEPGVGLVGGPGLPGFEDSFGLEPGFFVFVTSGNFLSRNLASAAVPAPHGAGIFKSTRPTGKAVASRGRVANPGVAPEQIAAAGKAAIKKYAIQEVESPDAADNKARSLTLAVFRPAITASTPPLKVTPTTRRERAAETADSSSASAFAPPSAAPPATERSAMSFGNFRPSSRAVPTPQTDPPQASSATSDYRRNAASGYGGYSSTPTSRNYAPSPSSAPPSPALQRSAPAYEPVQGARVSERAPGAPPSERAQSGPAEHHNGGGVIVGGGAPAPSSSSSSGSKSGNKN